jgi:hypothetical protein
VIEAAGETEPPVGGNGRGPVTAERGRPAASQAALLREAAEHPLVLHVRSVFDAAVRKVEPPRPRPVAGPVEAADGRSADASSPAVVADEDERDHAAGDAGAQG